MAYDTYHGHRAKRGNKTAFAVIVYVLSIAAINFAKAYERIKKANRKD
jgi:hypothetical protein